MTITLSTSVHRTDNGRGMNGLVLRSKKKSSGLRGTGAPDQILIEFRYFGLFKGLDIAMLSTVVLNF